MTSVTAFKPLSAYQSQSSYQLLPIRITSLDKQRFVISNMVGEYLVLPRSTTSDLVNKRLKQDHPAYDELKARHMIADSDSKVCLDLLAAKYRTKQSLLPEFTSLHMFVVTLRCEHSCGYCQVSRVSQDKMAFDMTIATAEKSIEMVFKSPSQNIKIEFQGGEPLLNFPLVKFIVQEAKRHNDGRTIEFVVATNLALIDDEMLDFFQSEGVFVSTSLDGPAELHNQNRPRPGHNSHEMAIKGIERVRQRLGFDKVSALMTCSIESLYKVEAIIDEYIRLGFQEIFLRGISPYGFAVRRQSRNYETQDFIEFYKRGLDYIINLNVNGTFFRECYSALLLQRLFSPWPTGFVDLQSPAGMALSALSYNYNGDVYTSDEGRMLAEMKDQTFRLGNVHTHSYDDLFLESTVLSQVSSSMTEGLPGCSECAFQPACGSDPVFHHRTQNDFIGHRRSSPRFPVKVF